jgi:hypothetical protein
MIATKSSIDRETEPESERERRSSSSRRRRRNLEQLEVTLDKGK